MLQVVITELEGQRDWELSMVSRVSLCAWDSDGQRWSRHGFCDCLSPSRIVSGGLQTVPWLMGPTNVQLNPSSD